MTRDERDKMINSHIDCMYKEFGNSESMIITLDTYNFLIDCGYEVNEALKLTEIICNNFYKNKSIEK